MTLKEARAVVDRYDRSFIEQEAFDCLLAKISRLEETIARVRHFLQEDNSAAAWRAVRSIEEAIEETECSACRAHLTALAEQETLHA